MRSEIAQASSAMGLYNRSMEQHVQEWYCDEEDTGPVDRPTCRAQAHRE